MQVDECRFAKHVADFVGQIFHSGRLICGDAEAAELDTLRHADIPIKNFDGLQSYPKYN